MSSHDSLPCPVPPPACSNVAQTTNVPSIETVIRKFLAAALTKVDEAKALAAEALAKDAAESGSTGAAADDQEEVDLDAPLDPSTLLMMSVDAQKSRTDRQIVLPALRFYWECLRVCLETLRNSARLEIIYQVRSGWARGWSTVVAAADSTSPWLVLADRSLPSHSTSSSRPLPSARTTSARPSSAGCAR